MACDPGDEARVEALAAELDSTIRGLKKRVGEIGDRRIAVMAGLTLLDRLSRAEARIGELEAQVARLERAREEAALAAEGEDEPLIARLDAAAAAVDRLTRALHAGTHALTDEEPTEAAATFGRAPRHLPDAGAAAEDASHADTADDGEEPDPSFVSRG